MTTAYATSLFEVTPSNAVPRDTGFGLFPKLPIELRRLIWTAYLQQQQRIITINIIPERGGPGNDGGYKLEAQERHRHSKLLRICREARTVALEFFSIRIPCTNLDPLVPLYFSPEYDVLYINQSCYGITWLADLVPKLRTTYDCRGIRVLNLAIGYHTINNFNIDFAIGHRVRRVVVGDCVDSMDAPTRRAFASAVSCLQQLWVMVLEDDNTRGMAGGFGFLGAKVHHNRPSRSSPCSRRLPAAVTRWRRLEKELGIKRRRRRRHSSSNREQQQPPLSLAPPLDLRVLLATKATTSSDQQTAVVDRATAQEMLAKEDCEFREACRTMFDPPFPYWGNYLDSEDEWKDLRSRLPDAVGFWLFPADAFADDFDKNGETPLKRVRDLRRHPPELCVFDMD
ncbi:hypothetical protein PG984_006642 [Apiospora sp. TS-2023a]